MNPPEQLAQFEDWVKTHGALLHHVVNGFAEGDDRNDLMQELLLAVWKAIPAFRHGAQPSTFIYRVSHNAALTWKRTLRNYRNRLERFQAQTATDEILLPAFVIWPVYVALMVGGFGWYYHRRLLPRKRELEELVRSYE